MDLSASFAEAFSAQPSLIARAPGRVNLLGEHVDYNQGVVLPAAIDRQVRLAVRPRDDRLVSLRALDLGKQAAFSLDNLPAKLDSTGKPLPTWVLYPAGVAWAMQEAGYAVRGMEAAYTSNVPIGSGLSSSAAVEMAFAVAWQALGGWEADRMTLAKLSQRAENGYLGVNSGLMDQFASAHGVADNALYFDTRSLEWHPVPLPEGTAIVIADSGVRRSLANSAYNDRRAACEQAVRILKQFMPRIHSLRDVSPVEFAAYEDQLPEVVRRRAEHIVKEIARVDSAVTALHMGKSSAFGALMFAGHASLRDLYEVSIPELDVLVELARTLPGCYGARLTGAGFGGCTVNLIEASKASQFMDGLKAGYQARMKREAQVYLCKASAGASIEQK